MDLDSFKHGGVNITGFRLVDPDQEKVQAVQREWSRLNPTYWKGAGTYKKIKVDFIILICFAFGVVVTCMLYQLQLILV